MHHTINSTFNNTDRNLMSVGNKTAYFVKTNRGSKFKFNSECINDCISFLVENAYFRVGNAIFRQTIGIPMGSDPAPFFANLFLSHYESQWIKTICRDDYVRARRLFNTSRFIDDLLTLNDNGEFNNSHREIYPQELVLNKENTVNTSATFLDLNIEVKGNIFEYKLLIKEVIFLFT